MSQFNVQVRNFNGPTLTANTDVLFLKGNLTLTNTGNMQNLWVTEEANVCDLVVRCGADLYGQVDIANTLTVTDNLWVGGYGNVVGSLQADTFYGNLKAYDATIENQLIVQGYANIEGPISAETFWGNLEATYASIQGNVFIGGNLTVVGDATFNNGNVVITTGNLILTNGDVVIKEGNLIIGNAIFGGDSLSISNIISNSITANYGFFSKDVTIEGNLTLGGTLTFTDEINLEDIKAGTIQSGVVQSNCFVFGSNVMTLEGWNTEDVNTNMTNLICKNVYGTANIGDRDRILVTHNLNLEPKNYTIMTQYADTSNTYGNEYAIQLVTLVVTEKTANYFAINCVPYNPSNTAVIDFVITEMKFDSGYPFINV